MLEKTYPKVVSRDIYEDNATPTLFWSEKTGRNILCFLVPVLTRYDNGRLEHDIAICFGDPAEVSRVAYSKKLKMLCAFAAEEE